MSEGKSRSHPRNGSTLELRSADPKSLAKAKAIFLVRFRDGDTVRDCATAAGVDRTTVWRWRQVDQPFDSLYRTAREDGTDVFRGLANDEARKGNITAIALVLKMRGALPGDINWEGDDQETAVGAASTVEDLVKRAVERGFVSEPKALKEIEGAGIVKVT